MAEKEKVHRGLPLSGLFERNFGNSDAPYIPQKKGVSFSICLAVAVVLWFSFAVQEEYTTYIELPTEVQGVPDGEALVNEPPENIRLQVSGEGFQLIQLTYNPPELVFDGSQSVVDVEAVVPELAQNVALLSVQPSRVDLTKEALIARRVPIVSRAELEIPAPHRLLRPPQLQPDSVLVTGASSIINNLTFWPTERVSFDDVRGSMRERIKLSDSLSAKVKLAFNEASLQVETAPFTEVIRQLTVEVEGAPTDKRVVTLIPPAIEVRFLVELDQLAVAEQSTDIKAHVAYSALRSDTTGLVTPTLSWPSALVEGENVRNVRTSPSRLTYYNLMMDQ